MEGVLAWALILVLLLTSSVTRPSGYYFLISKVGMLAWFISKLPACSRILSLQVLSEEVLV